MRLLITTQVVDKNDPVLGFFHRWIEEFATHCESVHIICLREGSHALPANVTIHSLGKETGRSRAKYVVRFFRYIWKLRREYDSVFVHMNPEYVALGGVLWRLWGKRIALWYIHPKRPFLLGIASMLTHAVCTATIGSIAIRGPKIHALGHGIDTEMFQAKGVTEPRSVLFLGRLDPIKRVHTFLDVLNLLHANSESFSASLYGSPTVEGSKYAHDVRNQAAALVLDGVLAMYGAVDHDKAAQLFSAHSIYVNLTPSGSFDKTTCEAMASGCIVVTANELLRDVVDDALMTDGSTEQTAHALRNALNLGVDERVRISQKNRVYVEANHALKTLIPKVVSLL